LVWSSYKAGEAYVENVLKKRGMIAERNMPRLTEQASAGGVEIEKEYTPSSV